MRGRVVGLAALVAALWLLVAGCVPAAQGGEGGGRTPFYVLHVVNNRWGMAVVYQGCNGQWTRIGEVEAVSEHAFPVRLCRENAVGVRMLATDQLERSDAVQLAPLEVLELELTEGMPLAHSVGSAT